MDNSSAILDKYLHEGERELYFLYKQGKYDEFLRQAERFSGGWYIPLLRASCFWLGYGTVKDEKIAIEMVVGLLPHIRSAAMSGNLLAQLSMGRICRNGFGVEVDYPQAIQWFLKVAEHGVSTAQNLIGVMYKRGQGVEKDDVSAAAWFRKAAVQGCAKAQFNLATMYACGHGVERDDEQAILFYKKAAVQGHLQAQNNLGERYLQGRGVATDCVQAVEWFRKAAAKGLASAQYNLGFAYERGRGIEQSYKDAFDWYCIAAKNGSNEGRCRLAVFYKYGCGIEQNLSKAYDWYRIAALDGDRAAMQEVGGCLEFGIGVEQDIDAAIKWYLELGAEDHHAKDCLCRILKRYPDKMRDDYLLIIDEDTLCEYLLICPEKASNAPLEKLSKYNWYLLLQQRPQLVCFLPKKLDGSWIWLIPFCPIIADRIDLDVLNAREWTSLIHMRSDFSLKCDWSKVVDGKCIVSILELCPNVAKNIRFDLLSAASVEQVLLVYPEYADRCDLKILSKESLDRLVDVYPGIASYASVSNEL